MANLRALWLPTVVNWASQCEIGTIATVVEDFMDIPSEHNPSNLLVNEDVIEEAEFTLSKVGMIYSSSFASIRESKVRKPKNVILYIGVVYSFHTAEEYASLACS